MNRLSGVLLWYRRRDPAFHRLQRASAMVLAVAIAYSLAELGLASTPYAHFAGILGYAAGLAAFFSVLFFKMPVRQAKPWQIAVFVTPVLVITTLTRHVADYELELQFGLVLTVFVAFYARRFAEPWSGTGLFAMCFFSGQMMAPPNGAPVWLTVVIVMVGMVVAFSLRLAWPGPPPAHIFATALTDSRAAAIAVIISVRELLARPRDPTTRQQVIDALHALDDEEARLGLFAGIGPAAEGNRRLLRALHDLSRAALLAAEVIGFDQVALDLPEQAEWPAQERGELEAVLTALAARLDRHGHAVDWAVPLQHARQAQVSRIRPDAAWVMVMTLRVLSALQIVGGATESLVAARRA